MRIVFAFLVFHLIAGNPLFSQHEDFHWVFGGSTYNPGSECGEGPNWIDFNKINWEVGCGLPSEKDGIFISDGTSTAISTAEGEFLFATDGFRIINRDLEIMQNGDSLSPSDQLYEDYDIGLFNQDCAIILPYPENEDLYLMVHQGGSRVAPFFGTFYGIESTYYSIVEMSYNNGLGKVVEKNRVMMEENVQPAALNAIRHANGRDWWIPIRHRSKPIYHVFLLDTEGIRLNHIDTLLSSFQVFEDKIDTERIQEVNTDPSHIPEDYYILDMRVSKNGDQLWYLGWPCVYECNSEGHYTGYVHRLDFDRCVGKLSHLDLFEFALHNIFKYIELCKEDRYLYLSNYHYLFQFDLHASDVPSSLDTIAAKINFTVEERFRNFAGIRKTPMGTLLVGSEGSDSISIVQNPELLGKKSNPGRFTIKMPNQHWGDLPNHPNFRLGPIDGSPCDTLGINNEPRAWFRYNGANLGHFERRFTDISYFRPESWHWDFGDGTTYDGRAPAVHEFPGMGEYYVCLTVSNENAEDTYCEWVVIEGSSSVEEELQKQGYSVYPNPTGGDLTLQLSQDVSTLSELKVYDLRGALLRTFQLNKGQDRFDFDLRGLASGMYLIEWNSGEEVIVERVVVD